MHAGGCCTPSPGPDVNRIKDVQGELPGMGSVKTHTRTWLVGARGPTWRSREALLSPSVEAVDAPGICKQGGPR